jgi:hypothetical protein
MQSPEEFMREYLLAKVVEAARDLERHQPFWRKFFAEECLYDSRKGYVEVCKSEAIVSVSFTESGAQIITRQNGVNVGELRYHLRSSGEGWLIHHVDWECLVCRKRAAIDPNCVFCSGTGWIDDTAAERLRAKREAAKRDPPPDPGKRF